MVMHVLRQHTNWCFSSINLFQALALFSLGKQHFCLAHEVINFYFTRQLVCNKTSENRGMAYSSWSAELNLPLSVFQHRVISPVLCLAVTQQEVVWYLLLHNRARQLAAGSALFPSPAMTALQWRPVQLSGMHQQLSARLSGHVWTYIPWSGEVSEPHQHSWQQGGELKGKEV